MNSHAITKVGVVGAGSMGAGIAQVAAAHGHSVLLVDSNNGSLERARDLHSKNVARDVTKGRIAQAKGTATLNRISYAAGGAAADFSLLSDCDLVVEAIVEDLVAKQELFSSFEKFVSDTAILATNTSSLSIAAIAGSCENSERVIGIHFFNPAQVMPLVEIIPALTTSYDVVARSRSVVESWGKVVVIASDTPGFIVNRIARPFYGEALRILEEGIATVATIDWAMREIGGFKMGPFELMDLIGNDVNFAVTCSVFESMFFDPRYRPSQTQRTLVSSKRLGRKTQRGYYDYREGSAPVQPERDEKLAATIVDRIVAMLINEAVDAKLLGVASALDIETAMLKGVNYPRCLLSW